MELEEFKSSLTQEIKDMLAETKDEICNDIVKINNDLRDELHQDMKKMNDNLRDELHQDMKKMNDDLRDEFNHKFDNLEKKVDDISRSVAVIEQEHGYKIDTLLNYASANTEKHEEYDKIFNKHDDILENHDARIYKLEHT